MSKIPFLRWWLITIIMLVVIVFGIMNGGLTLLLSQGVVGSSICFATLALLLVKTIKCGILTFQFCKSSDIERIKQIDISKDSIWMFANTCVKIGLIGTVIGFIMAIGVLPSIDFTNIGSVQKLMVEMSGGLSVALYTTLVGITSNILLNMQALNLTQAIRHRLLRDENDPQTEFDYYDGITGKIEVGVQINGKDFGRVFVRPDATHDDVERQVTDSFGNNIKKDHCIIKVIMMPDNSVNIVTRKAPIRQIVN